MRLNRILPILFLAAIPAGLFAQQPAATVKTSTTSTTSTDAATTATTATTGTSETNGEESTEHASGPEDLRETFRQLLVENPAEVGTILKLDPALMNDEAFVKRYPSLVRFLAEHPEVKEDPQYYLATYRIPRKREALDEMIEPMMVLLTFTLIAFALAWLMRAIIDQKRWNRLAQTQAEVHTKILDRFSNSAELLEYIKTPAGTKFLESAPIPLHTTGSRQTAPRVIWSVQIGIVIAAFAIGMMVVSAIFSKDGGGQELFAMGVIALCLGLGFAGSAFFSIFLSRRLGVWQASDPTELAPPER
ncbi:MAG TPA: hypothetical protein VFN10_18525 [Thermoanaerobaculia bacterium]|nr:hypothetical protein [Thermoanaerobaculia bacterium]